MIYTKLKLRNYRKFDEKEIIFGEGINVVIGANEAGKSTIFQAILDALYADPTSKSKELFARISMWGHDQVLPYLELQMEDNGIEYSLIKDFNKKESKFINHSSKKVTTDLLKINEIVVQLTGFPSKEVMTNTGFVSHADMARLEKKRDFVNALQNIVNESQEDVNIQDLLFDLDKEIKQLRSGLDRTVKEPGPIKNVKDKIQYLQEKIAHVKQQQIKLYDAKQEGVQASTNQQMIENEIKDTEMLIKNYSQYENASKRLKEIDERLQQYQLLITTYEELQLKKSVMTRELDQYSIFFNKNADESAFKLNNHIEMRKLANTELSRYSLLDDVEVPHYTSNVFIDVLYYLIILLSAGFIYFITSSIPIFVFILIFGTTLLSIFLYFFRQNRKRSFNDQKELLNQTIEQWKQKIRESTEQINAILDEYQCDSMGMFYTNKARYSVLQENLREIEIKISALLNGKTINFYRELQIALITEKKQIETYELTPEVRRSQISPQEYLVKTNRLNELRDELTSVLKQKAASEVRQEEVSSNTDNLVELEEDLQQQLELLKSLERRLLELNLIKESITEALEDTANSIDEYLKRKVERFLPTLTQNRYKKVKFNKSFDVSIFSDDKNDWIEPINNLSSGTVDQIYLLTRIAFMESILNNKKSPIILDDPFVTYDSKRLEKVYEILREVGEDSQLIIFSCNDVYADWGRVNFLN